MPVVPSFARSRTNPRAVFALVAGLSLLLLNEPALGDPALGRSQVGNSFNTPHDAQLRHGRARRQHETTALAARRNVAQRPAFGWPALVREARKYIGTNPTSRKKLWCATFMNMVLARTGYAGTGSDAARSFASYGKRIDQPRIGAIAVLTRGKRGGHVGIVTGVDGNGNPIIISGNHGKRVGEATYSRKRVIAYVMPVERAAPTRLASAGPAMLRASDADEDGISGPIEELLAAINAERDDEPRPQARAPVRQVERAPARDIERTPARRAVERPVPAAVPSPRPAPYRVVRQVASADIPLPRERVTLVTPLPRSRPQ